MLLKLIPLPSQPTIHFSLTLPTFPPYLDPPQSYSAQINHLLVEDLEVPNTLHSLDKSVGLMSLLEEVVFEIKDGTGGGGGGGGGDQSIDEKAVQVTCRFVDGALEDWVLSGLSSEGAGLISALECIIRNVQESTQEDDRERERLVQSQLQANNNRSRALNRLPMSPGPSPLAFTNANGGKSRHKKQRSLFMQIVSSIVNLTSTSSPPSSHLPTFVDPSHPESFISPPPSPTFNTPAPTPPSSNRARFLRRTARSNLVNTYRRHVLPELTRRFPKEGGFGVWILHSMRRRALDRMEDLIQEAARLQQQQHQQQQILELRQRHEHDEREQGQQYRYQQERARSPIRVDEQPFGPRFSMEEAGFSATTMTVPLSFSDEGGSIENENQPTTVTNGNGEEVEDDLETVTDGSSVHTPSSTSHIGIGFMGGSSSDSPPDSPTSSPSSTLTSTTQPPPLPPKSPPSNPQPPLPPHFHFEYTQLSRLRERLHSLILFADSQLRIADDEKRNREEILLIRGRRRAWLNGELGVRKGVWEMSDGAATGTDNGVGQMQWGFAAPFKSSPLARYSWSAGLNESTTASGNDANASLPNAQQQVDEEDEDDFPYDEFHGPPAVRVHTQGRQSRRSRYTNGGGSGFKKLLPVTEEFEYECDQNANPDGVIIDVQMYKSPPGLDGCSDDDNNNHRDEFVQDGDVDSLSDGFSLEDPRELDLELGFGIHDSSPTHSFVGEENRHHRHHSSEQRRSGESIRIAFEMERPTIIPRVRDSSSGPGGDDDSISSGSSTSSSTRSGGLLSWGYWGVGKSNGDRTVRRSRSWKNGIGIGIGLGSRGRSLNKTCQLRRSEEEEEEWDKQQQLRHRTSTSSTLSTTSTSSSTKSQQHQREPAQVELEHEFHRNQDQDQGCSSTTTPLLCQPVSFSISHTPAQAGTSASATTPTASTPMTDVNPPPNDNTTTSPKNTPETSKDAIHVAANNMTFVSSPLSFTTKKLCMSSPAPNVYADLDVSVVHVGDDQSINPSAKNHHTGGTQAQDIPGHASRLRPRRHKREYQYQHQNDEAVHRYGHDEVLCDEYELSGYGQFGLGSYHQHHQHHQHRHNSMIHARLHLDELLLEEGLLGGMSMEGGDDEEEFTLAMDVPRHLSGSSSSSGRGLGGKKKTMRKMQYLQLYQNRADSNQSHRGQVQQQSATTNALESVGGPVVC
ncbi:hypothetical protein BYT27DRAFT_7253893 [Phlegmacium glaucopus]|nr:hypothetical protein BYT27DRAFT_7253893 [Phlegmacium glaucopus]